MFLTFKDIKKLFPNSRGYMDDRIEIQTVAFSDQEIQPKGLYFPVFDDAGEIKRAIVNGAIAAVWPENRVVPNYTPNHFPIFLTNDLLKGLLNMINIYIDKLEENKVEHKSITKFLFLEEKLLNKNKETYDIAVTAKKLQTLIEEIEQERRG